jgi:hypothetical protein
MRTIERATEAEMIATFLKAEINSPRFGQLILHLLQKDNVDRKVIDTPNIHDQAEKVYRNTLLGECRGYRRDKGIFKNFPDDVRWYRVLLDRSDLEKVKYINYDYWTDLSGGSRLALDTANRVKAGMVEKETAQWFLSAVESVKRGVCFPELILVSNSKDKDLVMLEGHLRLTAYLLASDYLPGELPAIVGYSERMHK